MAVGRPPKPLKLVEGHLTQAERELRERGEAALRTSGRFEMWSRTKNRVRSKEHFNKIARAFQELGEDDVMYEAALNRYCIIIAECDDLETKISQTKAAIKRLDAAWKKACKENEPEMGDIIAYMKAQSDMLRQINSMDSALGSKRNALLQIEKENIMTVLAKLRAVPKKQEEDSEYSALEAYNKQWGASGA